MSDPKTVPYGSWRSPISGGMIVDGALQLSQIHIHEKFVYWIEQRPTEGGRRVLMRRSTDGQVDELTDDKLNVRTLVHEYGGGDYGIAAGNVYFSNFADQRVYRIGKEGSAEAITPDGPYRYADFEPDPQRDRLYCVVEDHSNGQGEPENLIAVINDDPEEGYIQLVQGNDFYANPRLSSDGSMLAWLTWKHPNMPWDGSELWIADLDDEGHPENARKVAGGPRESVFQPQWTPDGSLYYVADPTGWWNVYRWREGQSESILEMKAEFGSPQWVFGQSNYAIVDDDTLFVAYIESGIQKLGIIHVSEQRIHVFETPYSMAASVRAHEDKGFFLGGSATRPAAVVEISLESGDTDELRAASALAIEDGYLSTPEVIEFPTVGDRTAFAIYYPPTNKDVRPPEDRGAPLVVASHGGPTSSASSALNLMIQFWTSRGFAFVDVNYGGSTGNGREYRERLVGEWGVVDVDDCIYAARYLIERGDVNPARVAIRGGSAGGYTTLAALTFRDFFAAGASYYGVSDLEALTVETHKFESRYLDRLIGPYPAEKALYETRSPIHSVDKLSCPVIFFQGLEDKVVPPSQAEIMVEALDRKGLPVAYIPFKGEQHGFRIAENIVRALDAELYFYATIFGIELVDSMKPVEIKNLE